MAESRIQWRLEVEADSDLEAKERVWRTDAEAFQTGSSSLDRRGITVLEQAPMVTNESGMFITLARPLE